MNWICSLYVSVYCDESSGKKKKKKHKLRPYKSERRRTITETGLFKKKKKKKSSTWCVRWCMVCEGPILSLTADSCVYYRWNNLSNNDTTSGILGRRASVWRHSRSSPGISHSFNALMCNVYSMCMFFPNAMHTRKHAYHVCFCSSCGHKDVFLIGKQRRFGDVYFCCCWLWAFVFVFMYSVISVILTVCGEKKSLTSSGVNI